MAGGPKFECYVDEAEEHRWRVVGGNGEKVGAASEGFATRGGALRNALLTAHGIMAGLAESAPDLVGD